MYCMTGHKCRWPSGVSSSRSSQLFWNGVSLHTGQIRSMTTNTIHGLCGHSLTHFSSHHPHLSLVICQLTILVRTFCQRLTASVPPLQVHQHQTSKLAQFPILRNFLPATIKEISDIVNKSPPKHRDLDPLPIWLFKKAISVLAPVLCHLCNASLSAGVLPTSQKHAIMRPILKKPTLDVDDLSSYRPISNLLFISKTVERVVAARLLLT